MRHEHIYRFLTFNSRLAPLLVTNKAYVFLSIGFMFLPDKISVTIEEKLTCFIQFHPLLVCEDLYNGVL
jgi:hypothetical protein